ncbi:transcription repressor OFP7 [Ziziphus jujuba]|uniref:Transcription repressor n=1 Tax=Ziziphus jujuba TaxID=326968 RepID=A0A6P3ZTG0_ZIZJJ|nr:transcription repressor OFP7 [Ziziphus jujuba]
MFSTFKPMAKRFKLKFPSVIHSLQFCRPKDPSSFPENPIPATYRLSPTNPKAFDISFPSLAGPPPTPERYPSTKRHVSSKNIRPKRRSSCKCQPRLSTQFLFSDCSSEFPDYSCKTSSFAITERYYFKEKSKTNTKKKNGKASTIRTSVSSGKTDWFSSEGEEYDECRALVDDSRSLSDEYSSSESSNPSLDTSYEKPNVEAIRLKNKKKKKKKTNNGTKVRRLKRHPSMDWRGSCSSSIGTITKAVSTTRQEMSESTVLRQRMIMGRTVEGKAKESFAVVKKSKDPYEDFKRSMLEMIMEKQMFEARDLEELLQCFLTLNSRQHHEVIVGAFSEIWEVLFPDSSVKHRVRY